MTGPRFPIALLCAMALHCLLPHGNAAGDDSARARITGIVADTEGRPVAGAEVRCLDRRAPAVLTNAEGRFSLTLPAVSVAGHIMASDVTGERMTLWSASDAGIPETARSADSRLILRPGHGLRVLVIDGTATPVPGADVAVMHHHETLAVGTTDRDGRTAFRVPDNINLTYVVGSKPGVGFDYHENYSDSPWQLADAPPAEVTLKLDGAQTVRVQALGSDGKPVPGVQLCPTWMRKPQKMSQINFSTIWVFDAGVVPPSLIRTTDAQGIATFDYVPRQLAREWQILTEETAYGQQEILQLTLAEDPAAQSQAPPAKTTVLPFQNVSGKVLLPDSNPAQGILVIANGYGFGDWPGRDRALTRRDGSFSMRLESEKSYLITVDDQKWAVRSVSGFVVKEGVDRSDLELRLERGTLVHGTAVNRATGKPVAGLRMRVIEFGDPIDPAGLKGFAAFHHEQADYWRMALTDAQGRYSIRVGPGTYRIGRHGVDHIPQTIITDQPEIVYDVNVKTP